MNVIDLFSGVGGLTLGFKYEGFESVLAIEFTKQAAETFSKNHHSNIINKDIRDVDLEEARKVIGNKKIDVICGGPPCEGFSMAGRRDPSDNRNVLFMQLVRFAKEFQPEAVVMENVPALLTMKKDGESVIDNIQKCFEEIEYKSEFVVLNAADFGVPQARKRLILIATKDDNCKRIVDALRNASKKKVVTVWDAISDLSPLEAGAESDHYMHPAQNTYQKMLRVEDSKVMDHKSVKHRDKIIERFKYIRHGRGMIEAWDRIPESCRPKKAYASRGRRLDPDKPSFTVTAHCLDELIHPYDHRAITPREAARLQSFPDWYVFTGPQVIFHGSHELDKYEQIGDAVPPLLGKAIAKEVNKFLSQIDRRQKCQKKALV